MLQIKSVADGVRGQRKAVDAKKARAQAGAAGKGGGKVGAKRKGGDGGDDDELDDKTGEAARRQAKRRRLAGEDAAAKQVSFVPIFLLCAGRSAATRERACRCRFPWLCDAMRCDAMRCDVTRRGEMANAAPFSTPPPTHTHHTHNFFF